jgi:hypothetical protein
VRVLRFVSPSPPRPELAGQSMRPILKHAAKRPLGSLLQTLARPGVPLTMDWIRPGPRLFGAMSSLSFPRRVRIPIY